MGRLEGKVAVVTGASGGIGTAACALFCAEGASVVGLDIDKAGGDKLSRKLAGDGHNFTFVETDVTSRSSIAAAVAETTRKHQKVDVLFNNAGIILSRPFLDMTDEDWDRIQNVNLKSAFLMMQGFIPHMEKGSIVNVASTGAHIAYPTMSAYGAAKAGLIQLTRVVANEFGPNIRVNAICPGVTDTQMPRSFIANLEGKEELWKSYEARTMAKRVANPSEIASVALFLASDESTYVSGASIMADSGTTVL